MSAQIPTGSSNDVFISPKVEPISTSNGIIIKQKPITAIIMMPPMIRKNKGPLVSVIMTPPMALPSNSLVMKNDQKKPK